jgi:hypothetical protein
MGCHALGHILSLSTSGLSRAPRDELQLEPRGTIWFLFKCGILDKVRPNRHQTILPSVWAFRVVGNFNKNYPDYRQD